MGERILARARVRAKEWYLANRERALAYSKRNTVKWRHTNPEKYLLQHARARAKDSNKECTVTIEDIKIPPVCPVFKTPFQYNTPYAASIDRINPLGHYTPDNIQVISRKANLMKQNASAEELRKFAHWALKTFPI